MSLQRCRQSPIENRDPLLILEPRKGVRRLLHRVRDLLYWPQQRSEKKGHPRAQGQPISP